MFTFSFLPSYFKSNISFISFNSSWLHNSKSLIKISLGVINDIFKSINELIISFNSSLNLKLEKSFNLGFNDIFLCQMNNLDQYFFKSI